MLESADDFSGVRVIRNFFSYNTLKFCFDIEICLVGQYSKLPAGTEEVRHGVLMEIQTYSSCRKRTITSLLPKFLLIVCQVRTEKHRRRLTSKPPVPRKTGRHRAAAEAREGPPL